MMIGAGNRPREARWANRGRAVTSFSCASTAFSTLGGKPRRVSDQDRLARWHRARPGPAGSGQRSSRHWPGVVGDHQHFGGNLRIMSMPTLPNTSRFGGGDIGIAGADEFFATGRDRRGGRGRARPTACAARRRGRSR